MFCVYMLLCFVYVAMFCVCCHVLCMLLCFVYVAMFCVCCYILCMLLYFAIILCSECTAVSHIEKAAV